MTSGTLIDDDDGQQRSNQRWQAAHRSTMASSPVNNDKQHTINNVKQHTNERWHAAQ
jgi:hypothetical protein